MTFSDNSAIYPVNLSADPLHFLESWGRLMAMAHALRQDLSNRLTELYGPRLDRLLLFGSQARGDAEEGSDVDVLVVLHGEVQPGEEIRRTGGIVAELSLVNDQVISCAFVSSQRFMSEKSPFLLNVRREGIAL